MSLNDTNPTQPSILAITPDDVKFRHIGRTSEAKGGVVTLATYRDELRGTVRVGVCLTRPGIKYDAEFARIVAMHRIPGVEYPNGILELRLSDASNRVQKVRRCIRLTEEERASLKTHSNRGSAGYFKTEIECYKLSDFDPRPIDTDSEGEYRYGFVVEDIEADASHNDIDYSIGEALLLKASGEYPAWAADAIAESFENAGSAVGEDDDEFDPNKDYEVDDADGDVDDDDGDDDDDDDDDDDTNYADDSYIGSIDPTTPHDIYLGKTVTGKVFLLMRYDDNTDGDELFKTFGSLRPATRVTPEFNSKEDLTAWLEKLLPVAKTEPIETDYGSLLGPVDDAPDEAEDDDASDEVEDEDLDDEDA